MLIITVVQTHCTRSMRCSAGLVYGFGSGHEVLCSQSGTALNITACIKGDIHSYVQIIS